MDDMKFPERFEFHDWYLETHGEEYPYTYSQMHKILSDRENAKEKESLQLLINQFSNSIKQNIG